MPNKNKILVIGPRPPPVGGIASIIEGMVGREEFLGKAEFIDSKKPDNLSRYQKIKRTIVLLFTIWRGVRQRPATVFFFSSAYFSFWEKTMWMCLCKIYKVPAWVMMIDGFFLNFYDALRWPSKWLVNWSLSHFQGVIVQTEGWAQHYRRFAPGANIVVLSNGVDVQDFECPVRPITGNPLILFVGWVVPAKGIFELIEAAKLLRDQGRKFDMELVGPTHGNEQRIKAVIASFGLEEIVTLPGVLTRKDIINKYRSADIFVLPSWAEGLPNALLEAMASRIPVVATSVGGMKDVVVNGESGLLVPPKDPQKLAAAIESLIQSSDLRAIIGENGFQRVSQSFSNEQYFRGLAKLLIKEKVG